MVIDRPSPPRRRVAAIFLTCTVSLACAAGSAAAKSRSIALDYDLYFGGLHGVRMGVEILLAPDTYDVQVDFSTRGVIGKLVPWTMNAWSRGRLNGAVLDPLAAGHSSVWRGKQRAIEMLFEHGEVRVARIEPPTGDDSRAVVPASLRRDTIDLAGAILSIARSMKAGAGCERRVPIFDGRRRYDLVMRHAGRSTLAHNAYSPFDGAVLKCRVEIDKLGGFRKDHESDRDERRDRSIVVFIGSVFDAAPPLPVRIEFETRFGAVRAHLTRAETSAGDLTLSLAR